jgi:hypothetical protein
MERSARPDALRRAEWLISDWERPDDLLSAMHRLELVPAERVQQAPVFAFDIPAGPLDQALRQFERITGVMVVASGDLVRAVTTAGLSGRWTADQALARLLSGTSLSHRFTASAQAAIELRVDATTTTRFGR